MSTLPTQASSSQNPTYDQKLQWFRERFRPHFDSWVTGTIGRYISVPEALISFILVACAIDWLAGLWWGKSTKGEVKEAYTGFIDEFFPPGKYDADGLYDSLRNGLVHMFTIKGRKYALSHNKSWLHLKHNTSGEIYLNAEDFFADWLTAKNKFFDAVDKDPVLLDKLLERYERDGFLNVSLIEPSKLNW